jgi:hypothetical protein
LNTSKWIKLLTGCAVFGVLMGIRPEFAQMWQRAVVAGAAGIVLALTVWGNKPA